MGAGSSMCVADLASSRVLMPSLPPHCPSQPVCPTCCRARHGNAHSNGNRVGPCSRGCCQVCMALLGADKKAATKTAKAVVLDRSGFVGRPGGRRPSVPISSEPGEWQHGWQYHGSSSLDCHFRETVVFVQSCPANQAHLRSHGSQRCLPRSSNRA